MFCTIHDPCSIRMYTVRGGADKSVARPGRKQATANKLGIYSKYSSRSSWDFLVICSNFGEPLKKKIGSLSVQPACFLPGRAKDLSAVPRTWYQQMDMWNYGALTAHIFKLLHQPTNALQWTKKNCDELYFVVFCWVHPLVIILNIEKSLYAQ